MIPTLLGVMVVTFAITQFVPGGPVEKMIGEIEGLRGAGGEVGTGSASMYRGDSGLDEEKNLSTAETLWLRPAARVPFCQDDEEFYRLRFRHLLLPSSKCC